MPKSGLRTNQNLKGAKKRSKKNLLYQKFPNNDAFSLPPRHTQKVQDSTTKLSPFDANLPLKVSESFDLRSNQELDTDKMKKKPPICPTTTLASSEEDDAVSMPSIPVDLISNILARLPVKSLGKFKCVSKQWFQLISDPYFLSMYKCLSLENPIIVLVNKAPVLQEAHLRKCTRLDLCSINYDGSCKVPEFSLFLNDDEKNIEMLPSKWNLICFVSESGFYACNPSTQVMVKLPEASCCTSGEVNAGMGYVKERDEYILIHLFDRSLDIQVDYDIGCEVLRLSDGGNNSGWKVTDANCPFVVRGWGVLVESAFYWMIWDEYNQPDDEAIISFDLEKEEFKTICPPGGCFDPHGAWSLVELGGRLCLVDNMARPMTVEIWALIDVENQKWAREYSIDMNVYPSDLMKCIVPFVLRNGEILLDVNEESVDRYDVVNKSITRMEHLITGEWTWLRTYTESFFSLRS